MLILQKFRRGEKILDLSKQQGTVDQIKNLLPKKFVVVLVHL